MGNRRIKNFKAVKEMVLKFLDRFRKNGSSGNNSDEVNQCISLPDELNENMTSLDKASEEVNEKEDDSLQYFQITNKLEKDKITLDLINAVNQIVRARQLTEQNLQELQVRFSHSQNQNVLKDKEITRVNEIVAEKEKQIEELESKLSDKNIKIDHLMEEVREIQSAMSSEIKELNKVVDLEQEKNLKYKDRYEKESMDLIIKLKKSEELIINLETENNNLSKLYDSIRNENKYLLNMVNDFADRMSSSLEKTSRQKSNYEN